jgi:diguanylate cyclase (GGDEF)-like protein
MMRLLRLECSTRKQAGSDFGSKVEEKAVDATIKRFILSVVDIPPSELHEIKDALVILSVSVIAYLATCWMFIDNVFEVPLARPSIFVGVAFATFGVRRIRDQRGERRKRLVAEQRAHMLSVRDPLTQLPNRRQFETEVSDALRIGNRPFILLLGLEKFKNLDDLHGYPKCDAALCQISARLRDRVSPANLIARIADDEFAICLGHTDVETVGRIALSLVQSIKEPVQLGMEQHSIGANVGIVQADRDPMTAEELLRCAHIALSRARNAKAAYCLFDPKMDALIREQSVLENDLRAALGRDQIHSYYQPIVDVSSRRIVGFESLARWIHPVRGVILPDTFISLAEELGLIGQLSNKLFGDACRTAATWPNNISLSFNFSPSQLSDPDLPAAIWGVLNDTGLPANRLEVEVTESTLVTDLGATRAVLQMLRYSGVRIVIDDFGTGYSSLYHLSEFRFDKLKIDKYFIRELGATEESDVFARAIIGLSKGLQLCVTAEGVETDAQVEALVQLGVQQAQGLLFGKAMSAYEVAQLLSDLSMQREAA